MKYLVLIADIDEFNPCKNSLGDLVKKEYKIKHMPAFDFSYNNHEVTAVCFGIGKVNAAMGASLALTLGEYAFYECTSLSKVVFGKDTQIVTAFGPVFKSTAITTFEVHEDNSLYSADGSLLLSKDGKRFIYKLVEKEFNDFDYKVPYGVEEIGNEAFNSCEMNVELAPSVKKICANAFGVFLNEIIIPQSVNKIEDNAFSKDCTLKVVKNSYAHKWAKKHKIKFEICCDQVE